MRRALAALILVLAAGWAAAESPRLLVVVSVDQMRADYLSRAYTGGFKTLSEEGAVYSAARHDHIPTETGPGHAALLTGEPPAFHGIIGNEWYDRRLGRSVYVVEDSVHGLGPEHLLAYTLGDALKARDPRCRVVSISVKDRAAILMGGKKPDVAVWYDRKKGEFTTSSYYRRPDWLDRVNEKVRSQTAALAGLIHEKLSEFVYTKDADPAVLALALEALGREELGKDSSPDLLALGFSATDYIGHRFGPGSREMSDQLKRLDAILADLLAALDKRVGRERYVLVLTADHGVTPLAESPEGKAQGVKRVMWDDFHRDVEKALQARRPAPEKWLVGPSYPSLFLNRAQAKSLGLEWSAWLREAAAALEKLPTIARVQVADDLKDDGAYTDVFRRSIAPGRSGDLLVRLAPGVVVTDRPTGTDHSTPYDDDSRVPLVFYGEPFKPGRRDEPVVIRDLAPTLGAVVGLDFPPAGPEKGRVLREALRPAP